MKPNKGSCPREAYGKRVVIQLRSGVVCGAEPVGNALPAGLDAKTTRWTLSDSAFDVVAYRVVA